MRLYRSALSSLCACAIWLTIVTLPVRAAELVMFEQQACEWCEIWHRDIGPIYPKTAEGKRAPLRRVDIFDPLPADLKHIAPGRFTPTFVLIEEGREIGRIRGYPGEDFFWGLLARMIEQLQPDGGENPSSMPQQES